jgi:receptor expression-enhancing protein 1/2/3/4
VASRFYTTHPHDPSIGFRSTGKSKPSSFFSSPSPNSRHVQRKNPYFSESLTHSHLFFFFIFSPAPQGSTYLYKYYVEPYLVQNESEIDASIASARNETFQFVQSRLTTLWDLLYSLLSRTPVGANLSPPGAAPANGAPHVGQNALFQSVQGLLGAISPPAHSAAPTAVSGKYTVSRSASDTVAPEKQAPSNAHSADPSASVGYDVDETIKG